MEKISPFYNDAVQQIKSAILESQLETARAANKQMLSLYYAIGKFVSENSRKETWGTGAIDTISNPQDIDERVVENSIVQNVKNFILTFGKDFTYVGHQVHIEKLEHDMWVDLLFYNRELQSLVVEYLLQDYNQPMGVATYKVMPEKLKAVMPDEKLLLEVM